MGEFPSNEEVIEAVQEWMRLLPENFCSQGICKQPEIWRQCIDKDGDCIEKRQHVNYFSSVIV